jgi:hypothetical protein
MRRPATRGAIAGSSLLLLVLGLLAVAPAGAERSGRDGIIVSLDGEVHPDRLPRDHVAPVSLTLRGTIAVEADGELPELDRIEVAFGARGGLETKGLPVCPRARLRNATQRQALARCRGAVVGRGTIDAEVRLNPAEPLEVHAGVLAFNGRSHGRPAVWVHAYSASPPVSFVLPFRLKTVDDGAYGLLLSAPVRNVLGRWPRLRAFDISLGRRYSRGGIAHSYLSASCPLPPRFHTFSVPLARATYTFTPRPTVTVTHFINCRVSG